MLGARYFVPQCKYGPVGWYGEVLEVDLVTRKELETLLGSKALGRVNADQDKCPTDYFRFALNVIRGTVPVQKNRWKSYLIEKNKEHRGAPFTCSWAELWQEKV